MFRFGMKWTIASLSRRCGTRFSLSDSLSRCPRLATVSVSASKTTISAELAFAARARNALIAPRYRSRTHCSPDPRPVGIGKGWMSRGRRPFSTRNRYTNRRWIPSSARITTRDGLFTIPTASDQFRRGEETVRIPMKRLNADWTASISNKLDAASWRPLVDDFRVMRDQ